MALDAEVELAEITISIVSYNSGRVLRELLPLLRRLPQVVIVDNASSDGAMDWLSLELPHVRLLRLPENIGFGRAHNLAVAGCATRYALLLNPDCRIEPEAIRKLADTVRQNPTALLAVPRLIYPDGREQDNHRGFTHLGGKPASDYHPPDGLLCCEMVSGAAMLVNVAQFRKLGGFDPWFFLYWEDEDLCYRARSHKMAVILDPGAVACHAEKKSSTPNAHTQFVRSYGYTTGKLYLRRKTGEALTLTVLRAVAVLLSNLVGLLFSALAIKQEKAIVKAGRVVAVLTAPIQLRRKQAVATPMQLFVKR